MQPQPQRRSRDRYPRLKEMARPACSAHPHMAGAVSYGAMPNGGDARAACGCRLRRVTRLVWADRVRDVLGGDDDGVRQRGHFFPPGRRRPYSGRVVRRRPPGLWLRVWRMPARKRPGPDDAAARILLGGLASETGIFELAGELAPLHPQDSTFPGEVFLRLAADALDWSGVSRADPVSLEGAVQTIQASQPQGTVGSILCRPPGFCPAVGVCLAGSSRRGRTRSPPTGSCSTGWLTMRTSSAAQRVGAVASPGQHLPRRGLAPPCR